MITSLVRCIGLVEPTKSVAANSDGAERCSGRHLFKRTRTEDQLSSATQPVCLEDLSLVCDRLS